MSDISRYNTWEFLKVYLDTTEIKIEEFTIQISFEDFTDIVIKPSSARRLKYYVRSKQCCFGFHSQFENSAIKRNKTNALIRKLNHNSIKQIAKTVLIYQKKFMKTQSNFVIIQYS